MAYSQGVVNPSTVGARINYSGVNNLAISDAARVLNVSTTASAVQTAIAQCDQAWQTGGGFDNQKGRDWAHGCMT